AALAALEQLQVRAEIIALLGLGQRFDENLHSAAADQAVVPPVVVVELKADHFGAAGIEAGQSLPLDFGFNAAAAERARLRTVGEDQHCGAGLLRRRAARFDQAAIDDRPAG